MHKQNDSTVKCFPIMLTNKKSSAFCIVIVSLLKKYYKNQIQNTVENVNEWHMPFADHIGCAKGWHLLWWFTTRRKEGMSWPQKMWGQTLREELIIINVFGNHWSSLTLNVLCCPNVDGDAQKQTRPYSFSCRVHWGSDRQHFRPPCSPLWPRRCLCQKHKQDLRTDAPLICSACGCPSYNRAWEVDCPWTWRLDPPDTWSCSPHQEDHFMRLHVTWCCGMLTCLYVRGSPWFHLR